MGQQHPSSVTEKSVTFNVDKVELSNQTPRLQSAQAALGSQGLQFDNSEDSSHRNISGENIVQCAIPGLMAAIHTAYAHHYALKLSVSDFIILIGQDIKEKIEIRRNQFVKGEQNDWSTVFGEFAEEIKKRVKADVYGVIIDDTSVATPTTRIVSEITLMDAMKSYFDYRVTTKCGIPQITLEGTPDDWKKLQHKVAKLVEMNKGNCLELKWWLEKLVPAVEKICSTGIHRKIDVKFWSEIYKYQGGSGGPYITGWITTFFPYLSEERINSFSTGRITSGDIPKQISQVPFIWSYYGEQIPMTFNAGFLGAEFDKNTLTVKPTHFWSVNYCSSQVE